MKNKEQFTSRQNAPLDYVAAGLQAGIGQATNEFSSYGQGAAGYGSGTGRP